MGIVVVAMIGLLGGLPAWDFAPGGNADGWTSNAEVRRLETTGAGLRLRATGPDPILAHGGLEFPATAWQYITLRVRASKAGTGEIFWSGTTEGAHGGFSGAKSVPLPIRGTGDWESVSVYPGWRGEGTIRQLRLDLYDDAEFEIAALRVVDWSAGRAPRDTMDAWGATEWHRPPGSPLWLAPPLAWDAGQARFAVVTIVGTPAVETGTLLWTTAAGTHREAFPLHAGATHHVEVRSAPGWEGTVEMLGVEVAGAEEIAVSLSETPQGPPRFEFIHAGLEDGLSRAGRAERVLVKARNLGGAADGPGRLRLEAGPGLRFEGGTEFELPAAAWAEPFEIRATVHALEAGAVPLRAAIQVGCAVSASTEATLRFLPARAPTPAARVPDPAPVATVRPVAAYYFPGWATAAAWNPIRETAPGRKPALGYYDEALPEVVDWQIKWAREHGISAFLVDWYWTGGAQHLTHWFAAYRQARFREHLQVAIMWANHNPPGSHSHADWLDVTRHWIDAHFTLDTYLKIDGMPAVFLWDPRNFREDLGGSAGVRAALSASQAMAREAGHAGIHFATLHGHESEAEAATLAAEGYAGITNYHEWGAAPARAASAREMRWADVVATAPEAWEARQARAASMRYHPVVDTGWDARPWHGDQSAVIHGRDVAGFRTLLRAARAFADRHDSALVVLGPLNEWGEGSHIEPCATFGFEMLEAVREAFALDPGRVWAEPVGPRDLDLGPYDLPVPPGRTEWTFESDAAGWAPMMNIGGWAVSDGAIRFESTSRDPAMHIALSNVEAEDWGHFEFEMRHTGAQSGQARAQLFWAMAGRPTSEAASVRITLEGDGGWHRYRVRLAEHARWRGRITSLRFDPCDQAGIGMAIRRIALAP